MPRRQVVLALAGTFLAVAGIGVAVVLGHTSGPARTPVWNGPAGAMRTVPSDQVGFAPGTCGESAGGLILPCVAIPSRTGQLQIVPAKTSPVPGVCNEPMIPAGGTPLPCPGG